MTDAYFARDPGFSLPRHAARAFGSYQNEAQLAPVVWRFSPAVAELSFATIGIYNLRKSSFHVCMVR